MASTRMKQCIILSLRFPPSPSKVIPPLLSSFHLHHHRNNHHPHHRFSTSTFVSPSTPSLTAKAAVIGAFADKDGNFKGLTTRGGSLDVDDKLKTAFAASAFTIKEGKSVSLTGISLGADFDVVSVVGLGEDETLAAEHEQVDEVEDIEKMGEKVRKAIAAGVTDVKGKPFSKSSPLTIHVDPLSPSTKQSAIGEAVELALYDFQTFKTAEKKPKKPEVELLAPSKQEERRFQRGRIMGSAQNLARELMDTPANHMTPILFAEKVESLFLDNPNVTVVVRDQTWAEEMKMGSFISVSRGSAEPLRFVEIHYYGGDKDQETGIPVAFVGKGVTFDTGGISIKPSAGMPDMKADMGGAACVVGTLKGVADLKLKLNVKAFIPLCENMPGGRATKPGDVVTAMNGKTIQVDNTDAEGRLILADALFYATTTFKPTCVVDLATLTGAMAVALGGAAAGVFTNSTAYWRQLHAAGVRSGDRVWRMPLWKLFTEQMKESGVADLNNISSGAHARAAGACTAAGFLREFVDFESCPHWMHVDIAGVMGAGGGEIPYLPKKGMAGRPVRTLIEFVEALGDVETKEFL